MKAETNPDIGNFQAVIIGTGFAGLCMAIKLRQQGINNFVVLERGSDVGGTWRDNNYPGAACDIPSHLYSFSFAPNSDWSRKFPSQSELWDYLRKVATDYQLYKNIRFNCTLMGAKWDDMRQHWRIETSSGNLTAKTLVCGNGALAEPKLPDIKGAASFRGHFFHSSQWDHSYDLTGKRVAVVGTGASAIQFVPEIAGKVARLDVYQRTPNWILPRPDRPYATLEKSMFKRLPLIRMLYRYTIFWAHEARVLGMVIMPAILRSFEKVASRHIDSQVADPKLRAKLKPSYAIGCKRILISNNWYPTLTCPHVELVTDSIREIREDAVVTADGKVRPVDCIVFGTGFYATENPIATIIVGRGGKKLSQAWANGEEAFRGVLVKNFPNLFFIVGPNTKLGHSSMVFMIETQVRYIGRLFSLLKRKSGGVIEVRETAQKRYNEKLQQTLRHSIWATGCKSWYQHPSGKITALWPSFCFSFALLLRKIRRDDYVISGEINLTVPTTLVTKVAK